MNVPRAIEVAVAGLMRGDELGSETFVRTWQAMRRDGSWDQDADREYPLIDIRFSPERVEPDQVTLVCEGSVLCATKTEDDKDHAVVSAMYEAAHGILRGVFRSFMEQTGTEYAAFVAAVEAEEPGAIHIGGVSFSEPTAPGDDGGANAIGIGFAVHFSYA
jgi:hypothetical protein